MESLSSSLNNVSKPAKGYLAQFARFDKMLTPTLVIGLFWLGVAGSVVGGLIMIITGATSRFGGGGLVVMGLAYMIIGPLVARVTCELILITFKLHERLRNLEVRDRSSEQMRSVPPPGSGDEANSALG